MLTKTNEEFELMKKLAADLKDVKIAAPSGSAPIGPSAAMKAALADAKAATAEHGASSSQAALAWETVEEIAAAEKDGEATKVPLDEECLIELIEGCEALEKFKSALSEFESSL